MSVIRRRKSSVSTLPPRNGEISEESKTPIRFISYKQKMCSTCCGFYGPNFGQPLCHTCHAFLFPEDINGIICLPKKSDSDDSGNEEPTDFYETVTQRRERPSQVKRRKLCKLAECLNALSCPNKRDIILLEEDVMENLPTEVLLSIFSYLDDLSLWNCSQVCRKWCSVVKSGTFNDRWRAHTRKRWPLFKPSYLVPCWLTMYSKLAQSAFCILCLHQMMLEPPIDSKNWRAIRLKNELKSLHSDPLEDIEVVPLDEMYFHWQALIMGPADSPYEGGKFFLHLQIPQDYPMKPPVVRFITKIFHPNVSRHGNIGIDSIHHNWSLALTISKILISIQSLLTDPYCHVCMEPEVGRIYQEDRALFDSTARLWTHRYAMYHRRPNCLQVSENR